MFGEESSNCPVHFPYGIPYGISPWFHIPNVNKQKPQVNCPHSSILPTTPRMAGVILLSHDKHLGRAASPACPPPASLPPSFSTRGHCFRPPSSQGRFCLNAFQSQPAGLRKECETNGGPRKANRRRLLNKLKTAQNVNSPFETIIRLQWRTVNLRIMNVKQGECIYDVGGPERAGRRPLYPLDRGLVTQQ